MQRAEAMCENRESDVGRTRSQAGFAAYGIQAGTIAFYGVCPKRTCTIALHCGEKYSIIKHQGLKSRKCNETGEK